MSALPLTREDGHKQPDSSVPWKGLWEAVEGGMLPTRRCTPKTGTVAPDQVNADGCNVGDVDAGQVCPVHAILSGLCQHSGNGIRLLVDIMIVSVPVNLH